MKDDPLYLHKSPHGVFYYRRPIVIEDQAFWRGPTGKPKTEWNLSLRTKDRRTAIDQCYPQAQKAYQVERDRQMAAALNQPISAQKPPRAMRFAQDDPDYIEGLVQFDNEAADQAEWEAEHDPLYEQREALRDERRRLREAADNRAARANCSRALSSTGTPCVQSLTGTSPVKRQDSRQ